ncbi:MAG: hypothetical protein Q4G71_09810 [Pseudomonadota bacterium]|nr:hypothetical protein [Pseudomonadota bacterium]
MMSLPAGTRRAERVLLASAGVLAALAVLLPATALPVHYHDFADQRALWHMPNALDVLTNLPFAMLGVFMLLRLHSLREQLSKAEWQLAVLTALGLVATALCSGVYHLRPDAAGLLLDRAGMGLAFAGVLGLAVATRISDRAGRAAALAIALLAPLAAVWDWQTANMTPWVVLQGGGLLLLAALALRPLRPGAAAVALWPVLALYGLAKGLELADGPVLAATQGLISGHSAKHLVAALAVWPVLRGLGRRAGTIAANTPHTKDFA